MKKNLTLLLLLFVSILTAQVTPTLIIDNVSTQFSNVSLPYWLKAGQTINIGNNAKSVSILEFNVNGTSMEFNQVINLTSVQTVPVNKVWKIEAIGLVLQNTSLPTNLTSVSNSSNSIDQLPTIFQSPKKFETPGTYNWTVPPGVNSICVEVWGAGGNGSNGTDGWSGGGGGGGGYGYQCFSVLPGTTYIIKVGSNGDSTQGSSSFDTILTATGGTNANNLDNTGGIGGFSASTIVGLYSISGGNGSIPIFNNFSRDNKRGGDGGNGGLGGNYALNVNGGQAGFAPGGGGGGCDQGIGNSGGRGARGQVYIYW
jgi:hypothetical protein